MKTTSGRLRFNFWLDIRRDEEYVVAEQIQLLKSQRAFAKTIRDGIRLICDLRAGNISVLLELFPFVQAKLASQTVSSSTDNSDLKHEIETLKALLLRSTIPSMGTSPRSIGPAPLIDGPKPLAAPKFDLPRFDEDEDNEAETLILTRDTSVDAGLNFLNSILALQ